MSEKVFRDGTSQSDRNIPALREGYFHLDEMAFEQRLAMAVDYARLLRFHNLSDALEPLRNREHSVWEGLFLRDEAPIIAQIMTTNLEEMETDFRRFLAAFRCEPDRLPEGFVLSDLPTYQLARKLDDWFNYLRSMESAVSTTLSRQLAGLIIPGLMYELTALAGFLQHYDEGIPDAFRRDFQGFWFARPARDKEERKPAYPEGGGEDAERFLRSNFHAFYKAVAMMKSAAASILAESLKSQEHNPAVGLYMTFLTLYQKVQSAMNRFTGRHLDFYYHEVLKLKPRPAIPDSTYLLLNQDGKARHVHVPKGAAFIAGLDEHKRDVIFTADNDVLVGKSQVAQLCTLYFEHNPLISPERDFGLATAGKARRIPLPNENPTDGGMQTWPLMGAPKDNAQINSATDADLGFAFASPVLLLQEGYRDINIVFDFDFKSDEKTTLPGQEALAQWLGELAQVTGTTALDAFFKTFREMFCISLTTEKGWYAVPEYLPLSGSVEPDRIGSSLIIQIRLPPEADPITPYVAAIHGVGYDTRFPVIRFTLNPTTYLYPYSLITKIILRQIDIEVEVRGVRNLLVYNNLGQLDAHTPFNPFGPTPGLGSYFMVGAAETAQKRLTDLEIELEWGGLPINRGGFAEYYAAYGKTFNNEDFQVRITTLKGGKWVPGDGVEQPSENLFESSPEEGAIPKNRTLSCGGVVAFSQPSERALTGEVFAYTPQTKDGFFRCTLSAPEQAFGHQDYPMILTHVLTQNALLRKARLLKPIPKPPYTPLVASIALNYRASATLHMDQTSLAGSSKHERMFYILPFGTESVSAHTHRHVSLLPSYDAAGNLFIGLTADDPSGALTLFFNLQEDSTPGRDFQPSEPVWSYLSSQGWKPLEKNQVRNDGTHGFLTSGIVELDLPRDLSRNNTMMPNGYFWLRASVEQHPEALCTAHGVFAQAVRVSRRLYEEMPSSNFQSLPAKTIKAAQSTIPGIIQIRQPVPSTGGMPKESAQQFQTRVGERLRHKQRALVPWDFERLILERYPGIFKAKCFANMVSDPDPAKQNRPGDLLIVIVPKLQMGDVTHLQPVADRLLLQDIREFVQRLASPFARIEVRDPAYELIQVRCTVACNTQASGDHVIALNKAISDYLSPWDPQGYKTCFGWRIRTFDLESYIQKLPYIDYVTGFSMLRVAQTGSDLYLLDDSVDESGGQVREFGPIYPWSIAVPFQHHHIETMNRPSPLPATRTGVGELEIGTTLILS